MLYLLIASVQNVFFSITAKQGIEVAAEEQLRNDPVPVGSSRQQAMREGVCLKCHPDFLLYQATVCGTKALRYLMIPRFIETLRELNHNDDIHKACVITNKKVKEELRILDPDGITRQLPKMESTLTKFLCISKKFPPQNTLKLTDIPLRQKHPKCAMM